MGPTRILYFSYIFWRADLALSTSCLIDGKANTTVRTKRSTPLTQMPDSDFKATIAEGMVIVTHLSEGHLYYFPVLRNGSVSLHGARIEANPKAKTAANKFVFLAHTAARAAWAR